MSKIFNWFDNWKTESIDCPKCGWHGVIDTKQTEDFDELLDFRCPDCNEMLAIINFPTPDEVREHADEISPEDQVFYDKQLAHAADFEEHHLESPDQLPAIEGDPLILVWDMDFDSRGEFAGPSYTVIKHEGKVIWRERAYFECVSRFNEVVAVLREKYGDRLKALIPAGASTTYLYGDIISPERRALNIDTSYPVLGIKALVEAGDQQALNWVRMQREFAAHHLERVDQLPELSGELLLLSWDLAEDPPRVKVWSDGNAYSCHWDEGERDGFLYVTLRHESGELWREAATVSYGFDEEGAIHTTLSERYGELAAIAKMKYGDRLKDIVPTVRSIAYGHPFGFEDDMEKARSSQFQQSDDKFLNLWKKAVAGYIDAQIDIAYLYLAGEGVAQDASRAAYWCRLAADQGDACAQSRLAVLYENGDGVPQNLAEARRLNQLAADQGEKYASDWIAAHSPAPCSATLPRAVEGE